MKKRLIVLSGAGISAESGLRTFRDAGGLWEQHRIEEVCTYDAWVRNPALVLSFYNQRRSQLDQVAPNRAHQLVADLEAYFEVVVITQNVDNLHERAHSSNVLHLHGELTKVRSTLDSTLVYDIGTQAIELGDKCEKGSQLRPHIVWFGEEVPLMEQAASLVKTADLILVIGTSLSIYPAAGLIEYRPSHCKTWYIDPNPDRKKVSRSIEVVAMTASAGMEQLFEEIVQSCG